ncbi:MAG: hypothetical protein Q8M03_13340 [Legionella sp.]|nr:hypothetical protein [Legionella sp.]
MKRVFSVVFTMLVLTSANAVSNDTIIDTTVCPPGAMGASCMSEDGTNSNNAHHNIGTDIHTGHKLNNNGVFHNNPGLDTNVNTHPNTGIDSNDNMNTDNNINHNTNATPNNNNAP